MPTSGLNVKSLIIFLAIAAPRQIFIIATCHISANSNAVSKFEVFYSASNFYNFANIFMAKISFLAMKMLAKL